ncbi:MAG: hypothetical protein AAFR79_02380 [Pseudomonadota bacterium]
MASDPGLVEIPLKGVKGGSWSQDWSVRVSKAVVWIKANKTDPGAAALASGIKQAGSKLATALKSCERAKTQDARAKAAKTAHLAAKRLGGAVDTASGNLVQQTPVVSGLGDFLRSCEATMKTVAATSGGALVRVEVFGAGQPEVLTKSMDTTAKAAKSIKRTDPNYAAAQAFLTWQNGAKGALGQPLEAIDAATDGDKRDKLAASALKTAIGHRKGLKPLDGEAFKGKTVKGVAGALDGVIKALKEA